MEDSDLGLGQNLVENDFIIAQFLNDAPIFTFLFDRKLKISQANFRMKELYKEEIVGLQIKDVLGFNEYKVFKNILAEQRFEERFRVGFSSTLLDGLSSLGTIISFSSLIRLADLKK